MRLQASKHELRCICSRTPLLATYGIDEKGRLFVHIKIWKQRRIYGEIVAYGGPLKIHCRECFRWFTVAFGPTKASLSEESDSLPQAVGD